MELCTSSPLVSQGYPSVNQPTGWHEPHISTLTMLFQILRASMLGSWGEDLSWRRMRQERTLSPHPHPEDMMLSTYVDRALAHPALSSSPSSRSITFIGVLSGVRVWRSGLAGTG